MCEESLRHVFRFVNRIHLSSNERVQGIPVAATKICQCRLSLVSIGIAGLSNQAPVARRERGNRKGRRHRRTPETEYASQTFANVIISKSITSRGKRVSVES